MEPLPSQLFETVSVITILAVVLYFVLRFAFGRIDKSIDWTQSMVDESNKTNREYVAAIRALTDEIKAENARRDSQNDVRKERDKATTATLTKLCDGHEKILNELRHKSE